MEKKLGAHTAGTGDLEGSRGYFTFQNIMSTVETGGVAQKGSQSGFGMSSSGIVLQAVSNFTVHHFFVYFCYY